MVGVEENRELSEVTVNLAWGTQDKSHTNAVTLMFSHNLFASELEEGSIPFENLSLVKKEFPAFPGNQDYRFNPQACQISSEGVRLLTQRQRSLFVENYQYQFAQIVQVGILVWDLSV